MILPLICYGLLVAFFIAVAFSVPLLWVKIVCWVIASALTLLVLFAWWISQTYGKMGHGGQ